MRVLVLLCLVALGACTTPRQACERDALYDLSVIDSLIAESEQTLARGYALRRDPYRRTSLQLCYGSRLGGNDRVGMVLCNRPDVGVRTRPVAVDLKAERAKLAELKAKRAELARIAARRLAECRAISPQG
ncbi:MAG: hypothetical protein JXJ18_01615 [Rhodobacteraceae bacterium]|nr:hypothetical protein [Paracoccaceae bacterium]